MLTGADLIHGDLSMRACIYEDSGAAWLEPIALTRPAFALRCGAQRLFERHGRLFGDKDLGFWVRPNLTQMWKQEQPDHPVNDLDWARRLPTTWINGRWLPADDAEIDSNTP